MRLSPTKQKILLLLGAGAALGFSYTPNRQGKILKSLSKEWKKIDEEKLKRDIRDLYRSKVIQAQENSDGALTFILSEKGKLKELTYRFAEMKIQKKPWDGKWRVIIFDIPEKLRSGRDALRKKLCELGFYIVQKSALVFPYECSDEIEFLIEFFDVRKYVRYGILEKIDNDIHLRKIFQLPQKGTDG
ncbi:hypothetical protein KKI17_02345 [Patescibacteria group bacterium]|nr:hypothetical protein [Patescibacteria group bacterium]